MTGLLRRVRMILVAIHRETSRPIRTNSAGIHPALPRPVRMGLTGIPLRTLRPSRTVFAGIHPPSWPMREGFAGMLPAPSPASGSRPR